MAEMAHAWFAWSSGRGSATTLLYWADRRHPVRSTSTKKMVAGMITLELLNDGGDWFVLDGGDNGASIEGTSEEWKAIAVALRTRTTVSFRRCAARVEATHATFWSPRNAYGERDYVVVLIADVDALAKHIEWVTYSDWSPTIDAQCDDGRTPCVPPRPREAGCLTTTFDDTPCLGAPPECDGPIGSVRMEHWDRLFYAWGHNGPTCTASETT